jgi:C4-dicarboxylate transporter, DctM subunit
MLWYEAALGLIVLLIVLIALGLPIPFALAGASLPFLWQIQDFKVSLISTELNLWGVWVDYVFIAVPLFVFMGELIGRSRIGPNLFEFLHRSVRVRGSAAYGSIVANAGFGSVCGSSMVGALTIGGVALPEMIKLGYDRRLASGVLAAGGTLSVLIPPSLILLYFGIVTDQSIGALFLAGVVPGLLLAVLFCIVVIGWSRFFPSHVPPRETGPRPSARAMAITIGPIALIGSVITVSIYAGIATPTEAGAIACLLTIILAFSVGGLSVQGFIDAMFAMMRTMGYLGLLISASVLFGFVMTYYRIPQEFSKLFLSFELSKSMVLFTIIAFYFLLGMFLEPVSMIVITLPAIAPIMVAAGFDLIWFGIVFTILMEIAVLTPPVGLNLYVIQGVSRGAVSVADVIVGSAPFIVALALLIVFMIAVPSAALWLPGALK